MVIMHLTSHLIEMLISFNLLKVDGSLTRISVGVDGTVWGVNSNQDIYKRQGPGGYWEHVPGKLVDVSCHNKETVIGCNANGSIYKFSGGDVWVECVGAATHVTTGQPGHAEVWHVNAENRIWRHSSGSLAPGIYRIKTAGHAAGGQPAGLC